MSQGKNAPSDQKKPAASAPKPAAPEKTPTDAQHNAQLLNSMLTTHQKASFGSGFNDTTAERRRDSLLAVAIPSVAQNPFADEPTSISQKFDGKTVPPPLQGRDLWKAVQAPLQSRAGRRVRDLYEMVVKQFGVTVNPRYADDAPGKTRGHIFVWDVSRAMNCEIPHFVGPKELSLVQTCDWLRHEGPMRGWKRLSDVETMEAANEGYMVVVMPKERSNRQIALVAPQEPNIRPKLTGIGLLRSDAAIARELFGAPALECFFHE